VLAPRTPAQETMRGVRYSRVGEIMTQEEREWTWCFSKILYGVELSVGARTELRLGLFAVSRTSLVPIVQPRSMEAR
jgi:hypothetical protein